MSDIVEWLHNQEEFERSDGEFARAERFKMVAAELERLQADIAEGRRRELVIGNAAAKLALENKRLRTALNEIFHATSLEMLATNMERSSKIAHDIAQGALAVGIIR